MMEKKERFNELPTTWALKTFNGRLMAVYFKIPEIPVLK